MNILDKAADRIRSGGWVQGKGGDVAGGGPVCAVGAIDSVAEQDQLLSRYHLATKALHAEARTLGFPSAVHFNDHPSTSVEDVLLLFKRASERLDAEGGAA